jgi:hypothetical protein
MITQKTTFVDEVEDLLTDRKRKPKIIGLGESFAQQVQDLENAAHAVLEGRTIDDAEGAQLDGLGALVGERRNGQTDEIYRLRIRARIQLNLSSGTGDQILSIFANLIASGQTIRLKEYFPASFLLTVSGTVGTTEAVGAELGRLLQTAKAAGINAQLKASTDTDENTFRFSTTTTPEVTATAGFGVGKYARTY